MGRLVREGAGLASCLLFLYGPLRDGFSLSLAVEAPSELELGRRLAVA